MFADSLQRPSEIQAGQPVVPGIIPRQVPGLLHLGGPPGDSCPAAHYLPPRPQAARGPLLLTRRLWLAIGARGLELSRRRLRLRMSGEPE